MDGSVDVVVMDPPYYDNVMYAELLISFTCGSSGRQAMLCPELFRIALTDKEHEAIANPARFGVKRVQSSSRTAITKRRWQRFLPNVAGY